MATKAPARSGPTTRKGGKIPGWLELVVLLVVALLLSVFIKTFFVQMFFVPSESMEPLFVKDDRILVQKISYWRGEVERGDVVVFEDPGGWLGPQAPLGPVQKVLSTMGLYPSGGHLVKRVIAVGGDRIRCCDGKGRVRVNGVPLNEGSYLRNGVSPSDRAFDMRVPQDRLWVMGDNRGNSEDSRFHPQLRGRGTIPVQSVVGKVWAVVWPLSRFEVVDDPQTFDRRALVDSGRGPGG
jgi:signal peptidase I